MSMHQTSWSSDETETLRLNSRLPLAEIQRRFFPTRTKGSIDAKIKRECFERGPYRVMWPENEKQMIWQTRGLSIREVRKHYLPHRSLHQIRDRRCEAGIKSVNERAWTEAEDAVIVAAVEDGLTDAETWQQRLPHRSKISVRKRRHFIMADDEPMSPRSGHDFLLEALKAEHPDGGTVFELKLKAGRLGAVRIPLPAAVFTSHASLCAEA